MHCCQNGMLARNRLHAASDFPTTLRAERGHGPCSRDRLWRGVVPARRTILKAPTSRLNASSRGSASFAAAPSVELLTQGSARRTISASPTAQSHLEGGIIV